jgi:alpha-beta hydrolase superfamily lysophospholipase
VVGIHLFLVGGLIYVHFHQELMVYQPFEGVRSTPDQYGARYEVIYLETGDGVRLHGWYLPVQKPRGTILYCHGNAGNITDRRPALVGLLPLGFDVFIFDYRGFGESTGSPTEDGTYTDVERAWRYLVEERRIPPQKIVVWGRSLGGAIATHLASRVTPAALVLESTFTSLPDLTAELYWIPDKSWVAVKYPSLDRIRSIHVPHLHAHSPADDLIGFHHGRMLFDASGSKRKEFIEIDGTHRSGHLTEPKYRERVRAFLHDVIPTSSAEQID